MSDSEDTPRTRKPLGLKRSVDAGEVKQTFSHGRTNKVVVEVKRRRILGKPGEVAAPAPAPAPPPPPPPPPKAAAPKRAPAPAAETPQERVARLQREAEEDRLRSAEEARRREEEEARKALEDEKRRAEDNRKADDVAPAPPAEEPQAEQPVAEAAEEAKSEDGSPAPAPRRFTPVARPEVKRPAKREEKKPGRGGPEQRGGERGGDQRRAGKLTVSRALNEDEGARARSLAALKRAREKERRAHFAGQNQPREKQVRDVVVPEAITVQELANRMAEKGADLVKALFNLGMMVTVNQTIDQDTAELLVEEFGHNIQRVSESDIDIDTTADVDPEETLKPRPPVVTIMGHVDHGKTTLLDAIRKTSVVDTEAGGITQHIGAYQVDHDGRGITFLDTPGHEAFTAMRARGAKVTDIAVLVVAADDGVMPQTKESISHARAAQVPIVVAVNKVDVPDADPNRVRSELSTEGLQPEEWGGTTQFSDVSAKQGENLDDLLEKVLLVADAELVLTANPKAEASGPIIESRLDVGRGPVATMLVHRGTLRVGDAIVAGDAWGKVRALYNFRGDKVKDAGPGDPVEILGFDKPPPAGELGRVVENERRAREFANARGERLRREQLAQGSRGVTIEGLYEQMQAGAIQDLNLVLKGDVVGSVEAAVSELGKIKHPEVRVNVIHQGVGGITEGDIMLASASGATVVGFNVRPNAEARALAAREGVEIRTYRVIYQLTEDIEQALVGMLKPVETEETLGEAEVRQLFKVSRLGTIAGCMVTSGVIRRGAQARVIRDGTVIQESTITQLKRFKDDAREVAEGFECGILLDGFNDVKEGDVIEAFETRAVERTTLSEPPTAA